MSSTSEAAGRVLGNRTYDDMPPLVRAEYPGRAAARERMASL